jgi:hypothetical protein
MIRRIPIRLMWNYDLPWVLRWVIYRKPAASSVYLFNNLYVIKSAVEADGLDLLLLKSGKGATA